MPKDAESHLLMQIVKEDPRSIVRKSRRRRPQDEKAFLKKEIRELHERVQVRNRKIESSGNQSTRVRKAGK